MSSITVLSEIDGNAHTKNLETGLFQLVLSDFGYQNFRPGQKEAIEALWEGRDAMAILPTGGGKSLIFQIPAALEKEKLILVISPLIALMKDQTHQIQSKGIAANFCNSTQDEIDQMKILSAAVKGELRVLFLSPERAMAKSFFPIFKEMNLKALVVDEAHCVSQWGHDFRPEYRSLHLLREKHPRPNFPIMALTATATERVQSDITQSLGLKNPEKIIGSFFRPNLQFSVEYPESEAQKVDRLLQVLEPWKSKKQNTDRAIIYCATRKKTDEVYDLLSDYGFPVGKYHAGRTDGIRERTQNAYLSGKVSILVATNAFGMGIDQPNVRLVVHFQTPASMEAYYQEAGRAGRDGKDSQCILFFRSGDLSTQSFLISKESNRKGGETLLKFMKDYVTKSTCRQIQLCDYFGEVISTCGRCDICLEKQGNIARKRFLEKQKDAIQAKEKKRSHSFLEEEKLKVLQFLKNHPSTFGKNLIAKTLAGKETKDILRYKLQKNSLHGALKGIPEESIVRFLEEEIEAKRILVTGLKYPKLILAESLFSKQQSSKSELQNTKNRAPKRPLTLNSQILKELQLFRDRKARSMKWKKFMVFQNPVLKRIAELKPKNLNELESIKGVGPAKIEKFGNEILTILRKYDGD